MDKPAYTLEFEKPLRDLTAQLDALRQQSLENNLDLGSEIAGIKKKIEATQRDIYTNLTPWQRVQIARHPQRPYSLDYIHALFTGFQELHGDRRFGDDQALIGGTAFYKGAPVMIVAQQKGRETKDKIARNFGHPQPEGYRKAMRLMEMAEKFGLPLISFIDTPGAYPGVGSEERHVSEAIAVNLRDMAMLRIPSIAVIVGEGGSGGAIGIGVTNRVLMLENSYYSVITPEGCAAILYKDAAEAPRAASALKIDAASLDKFGIVDEVITEPFGGAHHDPVQTAKTLDYALQKHLNDLKALTPAQLVETRYERFRHMGVYEEAGLAHN